MSRAFAGAAVFFGAITFAADGDAAKGVRWIIGHRGSPADRPENTLASYRRAIEVGATAVEIDARTTKDGVLVSLHDADLARTADGKGKVGDLTLAEIRAFDAGSKFDANFAGERVPTVREILELCRGKVDVLFDLKETGEDYARRVADEIIKHGDPKGVLIGVRSVEQAKLFRKLLPTAMQIGLIPAPADIEAFAEAKVEIIRLWPKWLSDPTLVPRVRKAGVMLHLNAVTGSPEEMKALLAHAPESVSADDPGQLVRTLKALGR